jgi:histidinol dehydrogenase
VLDARDLRREKAGLPAEVVTSAAAIVEAVRQEGDAALTRFAQEFDGFAPSTLRVPQEALTGACEQVDPAFMAALNTAAAQIKAFHQRELETSWFVTAPTGAITGVKVTPLDSAGVYVPGGRAQYPSTVLMNVLPARVAGVGRVVMVTPPQKDGTVSPYTLAAAAVAGVDELYAVGGAQAIAALAYGTQSIAPVDKITGPGNAYVAAAKQLVSGVVGIDMIAGPSEVCVLADATASPYLVAADLMAQAEHDPLAAPYLVTTAPALAAAVEEALATLVAQSPRAAITQASLDHKCLCVVAPTLEAAVACVNVIAPEHLELYVEDPASLLAAVRHAGAIFMGGWSCEALGDYCAGPNHTLPTGGTAVFASPLSTSDFLKRSSVIRYSGAGVAADAAVARTMATAEGLWAHGLSAGLRLAAAAGVGAATATCGDALYGTASAEKDLGRGAASAAPAVTAPPAPELDAATLELLARDASALATAPLHAPAASWSLERGAWV